MPKITGENPCSTADIIYEKVVDADSYVYVKKYELTGNPRLHMLPHFHNAVEFCIVEKGAYSAHVDGGERLLQAGDMVFVHSLCPHFFKIMGEAVVYAVVINLPTYRSMPIKGGFPRYMHNEQCFSKLVELLSEVAKAWDEADKQYKLGFAYSFLGTVLRYFSCDEGLENNKARSAFVDSLQYIEEHYREEISLTFLADKYGYSLSYFSRTFNKFAGMNIREYINRIRIIQAIKIKREYPKMAWVRIMGKVGFLSWNTFIRAFAQYGNEPLPQEGYEMILPPTNN